MASGRRLYEKGVEDVGTTIADVVAAFEPFRERQGVELAVHVAEPAPRTSCDREAIKHAVLNLSRAAADRLPPR